MIPARYASVRYPGKPLAMLRGADGIAKPLLQRTWEAACAVKGISAVYVLTEDARIQQAAEAFGASVLMTSNRCRNGTERCAEALAQLDPEPRVIVNVQGDAPLTPPWYIEALIAAMDHAEVATPVLATDEAHLHRLREDRRNDRVGATTVTFDRQRRALYFSKEIIPFAGEATTTPRHNIFHHVGVYAYTPAALSAYMAAEPGALEVQEGLEQLRFLEEGIPVHCVEVDARGRAFWELNNPADVDIIEGILKEEGLA